MKLGTHNVLSAPRHELSAHANGRLQARAFGPESSSARSPGGATLYDLAYTKAVKGMRQKADTRLLELEALQRLHEAVDAEVRHTPQEITLDNLTTDKWIKSETGVVSGRSK